jgi:hypothetical protein
MRLLAVPLMILAFIPLVLRAAAVETSRDLKIILIDVEGGATVLFVTPEGDVLH